MPGGALNSTHSLTLALQ